MTIIPVLLYHAVSDRAGDRFAVSPARFGEHVRAIADSARTPVTLSELAAALRGERQLPERPVAVTFDDGYPDTRMATEVLAGAGLAATVYVSTGPIGTADGIGASDLVALGTAPTVEIGAHTINHPRLDEIEEAAARREILESRETLRQLTQTDVSSFAYPHGAFDARSRELVIAAGFTSAAAVKNALSHDGDDPWAIARWTVMAGTSTATIAELMNATGAPVAWAHERIRTRVFRTYRRSVRRARSVVR